MILQPKTTPNPCTVLCLGDSQTQALTYGVYPSEYWASQLQIQGLAAGYALDCINCGNSGWTTTQLLAIALDRIQRFTPTVLVFYAGVNDPGNGISGATTQSNIQSVIDIALANGVSYVLVVNTNYLNYSSGGDNAGAGTYYATYQTLRTYQSAAATYGISTYGAAKVGYCDLFTYQKNLVLAGTTGWVQGTFGSLVADSNQHMNALGQRYTGTCILASLTGVSGLLDAYKIAA
jgi:lysophospholipase L1-like esterase